MSKIDLHIHSNCSDDGDLSPQEIAAACEAEAFLLIAITDHNSVRAVSREAQVKGVRQLSGVELDCTYSGRNFHLLGYGFDHSRHEFAEIEADILKQEKDAAVEKICLFREFSGIPLATEEVLAASEDGVVTGELIASVLLGREDAVQHALLQPYLPGGAKSDMPHVRFYWDFFSEGKPAYRPIHYLPLPDAVQLIHSAGGVAVLAHPGQNLAGDDSLLRSIITAQIDGIEAFSSYHTAETAAHYLEAAAQHQLLVTCGSDFHGKHKPQIRLGGHGASWSDQTLLEGLSRRGLYSA